MELFFAILLSFIEINFILFGLLFIHNLRKRFGLSIFYIILGSLFLFIQFISVINIEVLIPYGGNNYYISNSIMFLPFLAIIMVIYILEGTLATQKLIIGILISFCFYIYLSYVTSLQCRWEGFFISQGPSVTSVSYFLDKTLQNMFGSLAALYLDLFLIPILYQRFRNIGTGLFISILGSLILTQTVDSFVSNTITYWNSPDWYFYISSTYFSRLVFTVWISIVVFIYIRYFESSDDYMVNKDRNALDIIFTFLSRYIKNRYLEKSLIEWEDRYRMVVENASDMIFIANKDGDILDINRAAVKLLDFKREELLGKSFFDISDILRDSDSIWRKIWEDRKKSGSIVYSKQLNITTKNKDIIECEAVFSKGFFKSIPVLIIFCRDITERSRLIREKNELMEQLYHTQRLESLGKLAGGIAHEFNNILHAIQGHIDIALIFGDIDDDSDSKRHLENVSDLIEKANYIVSQLLGFARKDDLKLHVKDVRDILENTRKIFEPFIKSDIKFTVIKPEYPCYIKCDPIKIQQAFLNIFLNAVDSLENVNREEKIIDVELGIPLRRINSLNDLSIDDVKENYYYIRISDNGEGMSDEVLVRIFEPFYTTKEFGKGTGMGLALVYGEIAKHNGFIEVESKKDYGTTFHIYLPKFKGKIDE